MSRTLIFGGRGQLGRDLERIFAEDGPVLAVDLPEMDITDAGAVSACLADFAPERVVNAAAYTNVEAAEDDVEAARAVNTTGAGIVAAAAAAAGVPVVYYSTDYVFGGDGGRPYEPDDPIAPRGVYARTKAEGEQAVRAAAPMHFIVRTAWLYGPGGNNFVEKILRAAAERPRLRVVEDEVGSPTHTLDLAEATRALCATSAYGVYHAVNTGRCSRYEFTIEIFRRAGVTTPVEPCGMDEFPMKAPRPRYSVLSVEKLRAATGHAMRSWQDALHHYMQRRDSGV